MTRIASMFLLLALAGCGNKGPLVMADPAPASAAQPSVAEPVAVPEPAAATSEPTPAEPVPAATSGTPVH